MSYDTIRELATVKETTEIRKMQLSHWCRKFFDGEEYYKFWELLIKQLGSNSRNNETDPDLANLVNFLSEIEHAKRKTHELIPAAKEMDASYFPSWITTKERISIIKEMMKNEEFINAPQKSLNRKEEAALDNPELQELERNPQWSDIHDLIEELAEETKKHLFGTAEYKLHDVVGEVLSRLIYTPHAQFLSQTNTKLSGIIQKTNSTPGGGIGYNAELLTNKGYIRITELHRNQDSEVEIACYCPETKETLYYPQSEVIIKKSSGDTDASVNGIKVNRKQQIHTKTKKWKRDVSIENAKKLNVSEDTKTSTSPYWGERDIIFKILTPTGYCIAKKASLDEEEYVTLCCKPVKEETEELLLNGFRYDREREKMGDIALRLAHAHINALQSIYDNPHIIREVAQNIREQLSYINTCWEAPHRKLKLPKKPTIYTKTLKKGKKKEMASSKVTREGGIKLDDTHALEFQEIKGNKYYVMLREYEKWESDEKENRAVSLIDRSIKALKGTIELAASMLVILWIFNLFSVPALFMHLTQAIMLTTLLVAVPAIFIKSYSKEEQCINWSTILDENLGRVAATIPVNKETFDSLYEIYQYDNKENLGYLQGKNSIIIDVFTNEKVTDKDCTRFIQETAKRAKQEMIAVKTERNEVSKTIVDAYLTESYSESTLND